MKRIASLTIPIGLVSILFIVTISSARASDKTSIEPITIKDSTKPEQVGPPWYNELWHYRLPVIISNSGTTTLPYYQVLVKLDSNNFNFNRALEDGSDILFTDSSGKNPISFWKESWDKQHQLAYLWVLVSNLSPEPYDTTIYLYYDNQTASPTSNGLTTFDFFDDNWCQFPGAGCTLSEENQRFQNPGSMDNLLEPEAIINRDWLLSNPWIVINGSPSASSGILSLSDGTGIKSNPMYLYQAVGFRANYGSGGEHERVGFLNDVSGQGTMIGDCQSYPGTLSLIDHVTNDNCKQLLPQDDWQNAFHVYEVRWRSGQSIGEVDHGPSGATSTADVPSTPPLPVTLYSYPGSKATLKVDWVYVRQYRNPEPTVTTGTEQGLVDLGINMVDTPDPLPKGGKLTYQLTVANTSIIDAPGVVVTDTLPGSVQLFSANSSQGSCNAHPGNEIVCSLYLIAANKTANITISVIPTVDGVITNTAITASPGYELDMSNNHSEADTLVDSVPPEVNWKNPVNNGQNYTTFGGAIMLEASATDNDRVSWVEFLLYDHHGGGWISIGTNDNPPYQVQFNSGRLEYPNDWYQIFVRAADRAGNLSNPIDPLRVIYIERKLLDFLYLPLAIK